MEERDLVRRAQKGDSDAFGQLMLDCEAKIYNLCCRMTGNPDDGAELAQEAFLNAWKSMDKFQGDSSFYTWVYRLANNACIDFLRKEKRRQNINGGRSLDDNPEAHAIHIPDPTPSPHQQVERTELQELVQAGLQQLSEEHREILEMREMRELSYDEIGEILNLEPGTVKSRIARARTALRKKLLETGNFSSG